MKSGWRLRWLVVGAWCLVLVGTNAFAADTLKVGLAGATPGSIARVPVYIRDASGTPLGKDRNARIQSIRFRVLFSNPELVQGCKTTQFPDCQITFTPGGVLSGLEPFVNEISTGATSMAVHLGYDRDTAPIPFVLDQAAPGDLIGHIEARIAEGVFLGDEIVFTLDPAEEKTVLADNLDAGTTKETFGAGLLLFGGKITISECTAAPTAADVDMTWSGGCAAPTTTCSAGAAISFQAVALNGYTFRSCDTVIWHIGDQGFAEGQTSSLVVGTPGIYNISMQVKNPSGEVTVTRQFTMLGACRCTAMIPASATALSPVEFAVAVSDCAPSGYQWNFGDAVTAATTLPFVSHTYLAPGSYPWTLGVLNSAGGCELAGTIVVVERTKRRAVGK